MKRLLVLTAFFALAASAADISGNWKGTADFQGQTIERTFVFKVDGSKLTGTLEAAGSEVPIDSGMVKDDNVSFNVTVQGVTYAHKGKYYTAGDSIGVDVNYDGNKSHMTMKRAK